MSFSAIAMTVIEERLKNRPATAALVERIRGAAQQGNIAFYPCNRCSNELLKLLKQTAPEVFARVIGCFDRSADAFAGEGVAVYPLAKLADFMPSLQAVIVTSNVFYAAELQTIAALGDVTCPVIPFSGIDLELSRLDPTELLADIKAVHGLLADEKSRGVYLLAWLARLLNDENLTQLFAVDDVAEIPVSGGTACYKQYRIDFLPDEIVRELGLNVYSLKEVTAASGDTVLDIGAFKGDTAISFADLVGSSGKVYSFEPVGANFNHLVHNVAMNHLEDIVIPVPKGCGRVSGTTRIATAPHGSPWAFFSAERGSEPVEITTIDEFVAEQQLARVDFVKLDVEGVELDVITGGKRTIAGFRPKMAISLYHNLADLTTLPLLVNSLAAYDLYIRCKMEGPWSIFLYCAPRGGGK